MFMKTIMAFLARVLRAIIFFPLTRIIIAIVAIVVTLMLEGLAFQMIGGRTGWAHQPWFTVATGAVWASSACFAYAGYVRVFERRPVMEFCRRGAARELAFGAAMGFCLISLAIGALWLAGLYRVESIGRFPDTNYWVEAGLLAACMEEVISRGVIFRITEESLGTWLALVISSLLFGFAHILNPNATWFAAVCIALEAGVLLAAAYVVTRRLWLPIGLHFGWNMSLGGVYGVTVSGMPVEGLLKATLTGPELLSGGSFGAEASIFAVLVCSSAGILLMVHAVREGQIIRPFWMRKKTEPKPVGDLAGESLAVIDENGARNPTVPGNNIVEDAWPAGETDREHELDAEWFRE